MKHLEELKESIKRELEKFAKQGDVSVGTLEKFTSCPTHTKTSVKLRCLRKKKCVARIAVSFLNLSSSVTVTEIVTASNYFKAVHSCTALLT
jgi:hypothetical protein